MFSYICVFEGVSMFICFHPYTHVLVNMRLYYLVGGVFTRQRLCSIDSFFYSNQMSVYHFLRDAVVQSLVFMISRRFNSSINCFSTVVVVFV